MRLTIDGQLRDFVPIRSFRATYGLPDSFGVALFEPKDYTGLGRIDTAGAELNRVRHAVVAAMPAALPPRAWLDEVSRLQVVFAGQLHAINAHVGLRDVEIEYAVSGFRGVCDAVVFALLRAQASRQPPPSFAEVYASWLDGSVRVVATMYPYSHAGTDWRVQIINHAYGRAGLVVHLPGQTCYVEDAALACPAEGFMAALLRDVAARILTISETSA